MISHSVISHWDEVETTRREKGHIAGTWSSLTGESSLTVGVTRIRVDAGSWSTPLHLEGSEEEIFFVLAGSGVSVQEDGGGLRAYEIRAGDCLVHLALEHAHTLRAGGDGLDVLAFGQRHYAANTLLPRAGVSWLGPTWVLQGQPEDHPWEREATVGPPQLDELSERPVRIVNVDAVDVLERVGATVARRGQDLGSAAGSVRTGLRLYDVLPGMLMNPPHSHAAEEEIFVVLEGGGSLERWPRPRSPAASGLSAGEPRREPLRAGCVVASRAGTGFPLAVRAGDDGCRVLAYGTREPNDVVYYPRSGKVSLRGVGVIGRIELLDYWDGED